MCEQNAPGVIVCGCNSVADLRGKRLTYENVKAAVLRVGRFSVFEATETGKHARIFDALERDPEIETDRSCGFPYVKVRRRQQPCPDCHRTGTAGERAEDGAPLVCTACQGGRRP